MKKPSLNTTDFVVIGLVALAMMSVHQKFVAPLWVPKVAKKV